MMTKENAIKTVKVLNSKLANPDFDFNKTLDEVLTFENWCVDDAKLLTWAEIDKIEAGEMVA